MFNAHSASVASRFVDARYMSQAMDARNQRSAALLTLLEHRKLPDISWTDSLIEHALLELSSLDSNNFQANAGVGEREARVFSSLVSARHYHLGHGVGRSGDVSAVQPKAAGSSLMYQITNLLALDALHIAGSKNTQAALVLPVATGMAMSLALGSLRNSRPNGKFVLWPRIDQKTCLKAIISAGLTPVVVPNILKEGTNEVTTDMASLERAIEHYGGPDGSHIVAVFTTTSCFAPRVPDKVEEIAVMCKKRGIPHLINNAYGVQDGKCMELITQAIRKGRVDAYIQSTDKNFMVPVGGSIVAGPSKAFVDSVSKIYPGRGSASPILDLFITLVAMGRPEWKGYLTDRKGIWKYMTNTVNEVLTRVNRTHDNKSRGFARILDTPGNGISMAISLEGLAGDLRDHVDSVVKDLESKGVPQAREALAKSLHVKPGDDIVTQTMSLFGSMLWTRMVSGTRVVTGKEERTLAGVVFKGYGASIDNYPVPYVTVAAAIGLERADVNKFATRFESVYEEFRKKVVKDIGRKVDSILEKAGLNQKDGGPLAPSPPTRVSNRMASVSSGRSSRSRRSKTRTGKRHSKASSTGLSAGQEAIIPAVPDLV